MVNPIEENLIVSEAKNTSSLKERVWIESKKIWRVGFPAILSRVTSFGFIVVTQIFIGHISASDLAAYALMQSLLVRFVNGILMGMSSATETLCGQGFGAGHYHMLGIYLQRSWIVDLVTATIFIPIFIFAAPIFRLFGEEEEIVVAAASQALWFIPYIYSLVFSYTIQQYLQSQIKNVVIAWLSALSFIVHLFLSWIFVSVLDWGIPGAMAVLNLSAWLVVFGEFVYIFGGWCPNTWKGFTTAAFTDIYPVVKLSLSSGVMICLQLWYSSVLVLLAGYMQNATVALSAFSMCLNVSTWELMLFLGLLAATSIRVSNELGRGNAEAAKFSIKVILITSTCLGVVFWILWLVFGREISYLLTSDEEVAEYMTSLSVLVAFSMLLNSIQPILSGTAVGSGRQSVVAFINIGSYYVIGIPLGVLLGYVAGLQVLGLWIGLFCGIALQILVLGYITWKTDWDEQVNKASERLNRFLIVRSEEANQSSPGT